MVSSFLWGFPSGAGLGVGRIIAGFVFFGEGNGEGEDVFPHGGGGKDFGVAALVHGPCDEAVFRHSPDVQFAATVWKWYNLLFGVERMRLNEA